MGRAVVALAAMHAGLCYLYLYFFELGFRSNIGILLSIENIFSISLDNILPFYAASAFFLLYSYITYERNPFEIRADKRLEILESAALGISFKFVFISSVLVLFVGLYFLVFEALFIRALFLPLVLCVAWFAIKTVSEASNFGGTFKIASLVTVYLFINFSTLAHENGFNFRTKPYNYFVSPGYKSVFGSFPTCLDEALLLMPVGDGYLAVKPNSERYIYSNACKPLFKITGAIVEIDIP